MKRQALLAILLAAAAAAAGPPPPDADWVAMVATNAAATSEAGFRDRLLMPLLREEALAPLLAGPDAGAPWFDEATNYVERELLLAWEGAGWMPSPKNPHWGRAYDFTIREGSKDPLLTWMSVVGQKKWHWDDKAREQLAELEAALAARPAGEALFARLLAAHARQFVDPAPEHARALCSAAVRWTESHAARPDRSEAVLRVLEQFVDVCEPAFVSALLESKADPWIGLVAAGCAAFARHHATCDPEERERHVGDAEAAWRRAWELHPEFPQGAEGMMRVAAHRKDRAGVGSWFRAGVAARYDSPSLHDRYVAFLRPAYGGSIEALHGHARDCFEAADPGCFPDAAARERARSMLPYGGVLALLAALDASGGKPAEFFPPGDAAEIDAALRPMLGEDPAIGPSGAKDLVRFESAWFLAAVHWVLDDEEGALRAYETVRNLPGWYCRRMQESFPGAYDIGIALSALAGPDADLVRALRRSFRDGDFDGVVARCEEALAPRPGLDRSEMIFLEKLSVRAFLAAGFLRGETRRVPITPHGAFSGWYDYGNGWQPEIDDDGGYVWYTGRGPCGELEFGSPLPLPLEIETAFEPSADPATNVLFAVRVFPSDLLFGNHDGPTPALSVRLEGGTLRVRLGPAGDPDLDWGVDKATPVFETNAVLSAVLHAEGAENKPHAESAEGAENKPHAESAEGAENKPHAESAEGAENKPHAESAEGAENKPHAESAESAESDIGARSPSAPDPSSRGLQPEAGGGDIQHSAFSIQHSPARVPLRVIFLEDRVRCYLGNADTPALDAPCTAFAPADFPDGAKLVFYGARCRFFGFSFRNPAAKRP